MDQDHRDFLDDLHLPGRFPRKEETEASLEASLRRLDAAQQGAFPQGRGARVRRILRWSLAAAALLAVCAGGYFFWSKPGPLQVEVLADASGIEKVLLPDSSVVTLNRGSRITYRPSVADSREVWLEGEGHFRVHHIGQQEGARLFRVRTPGMTIEVLGTEFNVKRSGNLTNVSLESGSIRITLDADPDAVLYLKPGDFIQYRQGESTIRKKAVRPLLYSGWKERELSLDGLTLREVAGLLTDVYGYKVIIPSGPLAESRLSGTLQAGDESALLQAISFALDLGIRREGQTLIFEPQP